MKRLGSIFSLLALGCGPSAGNSSTDGSGTGSSTPSASQTQGGSSMETTAAAGVTSAGSGGSETSPQTSSSSGAVTSATGSDTGQTDTGGGGAACALDTDCKLDNDCCGCNALPVDDEPRPCPADCRQGMCDAVGIERAVCRFGVCTVQKLGCNPQNVQCDAPTPQCGDGTTARVEGGCWTGECIPYAYCDWVPDCTACAQDEICVELLGGPKPTVPQHVCEPVAPECIDMPTCACLGEIVCEGVGSCEDDGKNQIACVGK